MFKKKICISRIDKMGDMILTLPVIKSIKIQNPGSEVHVLASVHNAKVLKNIKYVDEVINKFVNLKCEITFFLIKHLSPIRIILIQCLFIGTLRHGFAQKPNPYLNAPYDGSIFSKIGHFYL